MLRILRTMSHQSLHISDIVGEMMHHVSSVAREQLISSDILTMVLQLVRELEEDRDESKDYVLMVVEDHPVDPSIMIREKVPLGPQSLSLMHPSSSNGSFGTHVS